MCIAITTGSIAPSEAISQYKIISANTVNVRIDEIYFSEIELMKTEFAEIKCLCGTADVWSTKRKSFMGVTIHWVDEKTLDRQSRVLCCRRFLSPHDNVRIAHILHEIYTDFNISNKILCTVTDNASNFVKAFKDFGVTFDSFLSFMADTNDQNKNDELNESLCAETNDSFLDEDENPDMEEPFIEFFELTDNVLLSAHFRCGSHTFCRVAAKDASDAMNDTRYAKQHESAFKKNNSLFKKTNLPKSSEIIRNILKKSLVLPAKTRWNSLFDSVEHILKFELKVLNTVMLELDLQQFTQADYDFLK